jgi:hypothetical protein
MRFQISLETTTPTAHITDHEVRSQSYMMQETQGSRYTQIGEQPWRDRKQRIPRHEQDEDRWRFERPIPGRDPVTEERGMGG